MEDVDNVNLNSTAECSSDELSLYTLNTSNTEKGLSSAKPNPVAVARAEPTSAVQPAQLCTGVDRAESSSAREIEMDNGYIYGSKELEDTVKKMKHC